MRIALRINGELRYIASMEGPGFLGAHLNLHDRPKEDDHSRSVSVNGTRTLDTETVRLRWPPVDLQLGDSVEISFLDEGQGDPPVETKRSSEAENNLFSEPELAGKVLAAVSDFETRLMQLVDESKTREPEGEHQKFGKAVGKVAMDLGNSLLYPIYRRHPDLLPEALRGEIL